MKINKGGFEKTFLISVLITFIGILLPWVDSIKGNISGIENFYGMFILILLLVSLGILSFLLVMRTFTELGYAINPLTRIFVDYGIGVYITALGSIGIAIAGIVGLKEKK